MEISSKDPLSSIAEGVTKATLNSSIDGLKNWIDKFKNKKLAFIRERETIDMVRAQLKSNELSFYKNYIDDPTIKDYILMGLTLRKLESKSDFKRIKNLRNKIYKKYDLKGLHASQLVQNGVLSRHITNLMENIDSLEILKKRN